MICLLVNLFSELKKVVSFVSFVSNVDISRFTDKTKGETNTETKNLKSLLKISETKISETKKIVSPFCFTSILRASKDETNETNETRISILL